MDELTQYQDKKQFLHLKYYNFEFKIYYNIKYLLSIHILYVTVKCGESYGI